MIFPDTSQTFGQFPDIPGFPDGGHRVVITNTAVNFAWTSEGMVPFKTNKC